MFFNLRQWGRTSKQIVEFLSYLAVIGGIAIYFGFERRDMRHNARVEHVFQYIERFHEGEVAASRMALIHSWIEHEEDLRQWARGSAPASVFQSWVYDIVAETPRDGSAKDLRSAVYTVTEFFDALSLCVARDICDGATAEQYFGTYAEQFRCLYKVVIDRLRSGLTLSNFGKGIEDIAPGEKTCKAGVRLSSDGGT